MVVPMSTTHKAQPDVDSPELADHMVKALLNKLAMEKFEMISDQIIHWANTASQRIVSVFLSVAKCVYCAFLYYLITLTHCSRRVRLFPPSWTHVYVHPTHVLASD
jgi:hypothetical protein